MPKLIRKTIYKNYYIFSNMDKGIGNITYFGKTKVLWSRNIDLSHVS